MPKPQIGPEEQPPLHPGSAARHLPAPAHYLVTLWGQNGNSGGKWVLPGLHGELDQEDQADHQLIQRGEGTYVRGELATQVSQGDRNMHPGSYHNIKMSSSLLKPYCQPCLFSLMNSSEMGEPEVWSLRHTAVHSELLRQALSEQLHPFPTPRVVVAQDVRKQEERGVVVWVCEHLWSEWRLIYSCLPVTLFLCLLIFIIYLNIFFLCSCQTLQLSFLKLHRAFSLSFFCLTFSLCSSKTHTSLLSVLKLSSCPIIFVARLAEVKLIRYSSVALFRNYPNEDRRYHRATWGVFSYCIK